MDDKEEFKGLDEIAGRQNLEAIKISLALINKMNCKALIIA